MKSKLIIAGIIIALLTSLIGAIAWGVSQTKEKVKYKNNYEAVTLYRDQEQTLYVNELKSYNDIVIKLQKELGIKPKQIEHFTQGEIQYQDTGSVKIKYKDREVKVYPDSLYFAIARPCYDLSLLIYKGKAYESLKYHDTITGTLYKERPHKFLFVRYGKWIHKAAIYSSCRDTSFIPFNNVKVVR
ncbi:MAG: DUF6549 family protein [Parabacteroides sp.]